MDFTPYQRKLVERAKNYPFGTPDASYLFIDGECSPVAFYDEEQPENTALVVRNIRTSASTLLRQKQIDVSVLRAPRLPVLASGSNASPTRLREKFDNLREACVIPVIRYSVKNMLPVFSAKLASYGSITATLQHVPECETQIFATFLTLAQLERMHETEAIGDEYVFQRLKNLAMRQNGSKECVCRTAYAYISRKGVLAVNGQQFTLDATHYSNNNLRYSTQNEALTLARNLVEPQQGLDFFILQNILHRQTRDKTNQKLQSFSVPFAYKDAFNTGPSLEALF